MAYRRKSMNEFDQYEDMTPNMGDTVVTMPMTFEKKGGRQENTQQKIIWFIIETVAVLIILLMYLLQSELTLGTIFKAFCIVFIYQLIARKVIFKEGYYKKCAKELEDNDYSYSSRVFWNIYAVTDEKPYICYFKNGEIGMFVRLEKDVIVGDLERLEYENYEAISEAYRLLGNSGISYKYIDTMDSIGNDDRLDLIYENIENSVSKQIKEIYTCVFENLKFNMQREYTSHDIYLFKAKMSEDDFYYEVLKALQQFMQGSYTSYTILKTELKDLTENLMNMEDFSVIGACKEVKNSRKVNGITIIYTENFEGEKTVYNKTSEEKAMERRIKSREKSARKLMFGLKDEEIKLDNEDDDDDIIEL